MCARQNQIAKSRVPTAMELVISERALADEFASRAACPVHIRQIGLAIRWTVAPLPKLAVLLHAEPAGSDRL
jgi:hypothetical protein